jgi:hypothetical protein
MRKFKKGDLVSWSHNPKGLYRFNNYKSENTACDSICIHEDGFKHLYHTKTETIKKVGIDENNGPIIKNIGKLIMEELKKMKYAHYFKDVSNLQEIDVYRVLTLFDVTNPCLSHAIKKLLVAGGRGGGKDIQKDVQEAIDSLSRFIEMQAEDQKAKL